MQAAPADPEAARLCRLSAQLKCLLEPEFPDCADTEIVLAARAGETVAAHKCILMARSSVIRNHFSSLPTPAAAPEKHMLYLADLVPGGRHIGRDALVAVLAYMYTSCLTWPLQEWACMDDACRHGACRPAIDFVVECMYAASGFQITELASLVKNRLFYLVGIACDEDIIPVIHVADTCQLPNLLDRCISRVAKSTLVNKYLEKQLPCHIYNDIKALGQCSFLDVPENFILDPENEKTVRNIHEALDSGNVDLVAMLLKQSAVTLDDALAIHYAAAKCEPKVLAELLKLDSANVNLRNDSGYTPLHMACMRLEPDIIVSLLEKRASVLERTPDERDPLTICKRLTRQKKYIRNRELQKGQERSNAYLCIDILEQTQRIFTLDMYSSEQTIDTPLLNHNFQEGLEDLEIRVSLAKLVFPSEAQLAMRIAEVYSTEEFYGTKLELSLNGTPTMQRRLRERVDALTKTVELGRRYFPNCSDVLDKFLDEDLETSLRSVTPEAKRRFSELRENVRTAFNKDMAVGVGIASTASSSSSPRLEMLIPASNPSQAEGAAGSSDELALLSDLSIQAPCAGTDSRRLESQNIDAVVDDEAGVGSKRKQRSQVWHEFKRVKQGNAWFAICKWCCKSLTANTKNGTNHMRRHLVICQSRQATKGLNLSTFKSSQNQEGHITLEKNVFDQENARKELALMICLHEYPLSMVEHVGFRKFCAAMQPMFNVVSKNTIRKDILDIYEMQKLCIMKGFQQCQARIAITMDMWTTGHSKKGYMAITVHYIDDNWKLKSYLLRFISVPAPHTGEVISDALHDVLKEWHIEKKLSTVTLDNCTTSHNLMEKMVHKLPPDSLMLDGSLLHMRYAPHRLNLIVQNGMSLLEERIEKVRESVAFWVATPDRLNYFEEVASQMNIKHNKRISSDCETRWDSTYAMLRTALDYREVFVSLAHCEKFTASCPATADSDWKFARELCDRLKMFFDISELLSGATYVTANLFFPKICGIYLAIREWQASEDPMIEKMSKLVKEKFEKYWLDVHDLMAVAIVLDPRYKLHMLKAIFIKIYGEEDESVKVAEVNKLLSNLVLQYKNPTESVATICGAPSAIQNQGNGDVFDLYDQLIMSAQPAVNSYVHTELDLYLKESILPRTQDEIDIINWWQFEGAKYPILRKIARDIMAISVAVPSKPVFGTGERIISPNRSRLAPQILEAVMCMQSWSRSDMLGPDFTTVSSLMTCLEEEEEREREVEDAEYSMV